MAGSHTREYALGRTYYHSLRQEYKICNGCRKDHGWDEGDLLDPDIEEPDTSSLLLGHNSSTSSKAVCFTYLGVVMLCIMLISFFLK